MGKDQGKSEVIEYRGIKFRRYPGSLVWTIRNYYTPNASYRKRGVGALHREIWKDANGPIPTGYEIHHRDGNPLNNDLSNLECLSKSEHQARHELHGESERRKFLREVVQPKASAAARRWHQSEAGRAWHRELGQLSLDARYKVWKQCERCGKDYELWNTNASYSRFCSGACKAAARRASGIDLVTANCARCGCEIKYDKNQPRTFCSRACSARARAGR